jgi:hypothetical protein
MQVKSSNKTISHCTLVTILSISISIPKENTNLYYTPSQVRITEHSILDGCRLIRTWLLVGVISPYGPGCNYLFNLPFRLAFQGCAPSLL